MIRLNKKRVVEYFWLIPLLVWAVFFFLLSHKSMILMGDTMEYFDMARQLNDGVFPKSDKWMPLYPFMIWITSKIFVVNLMVGSKIYHFLLSSIFVLLYNIFFVNEYAEKIYEKLILNAPIFCFPLFLKFSVTWMAEFQFVFLTCLVLFHLFEIVKSSQIIHVFWASIFVLLCIFTKYNGFVNLILLIMVIWYRYPPKMSMILSSVLLSLMALTYGLWLYFKPGGEFLVGGINDLITSEILIKTFLISSCDFFITISKYYTPYRIQEILQNSLNQYVAGFLFLLTILVLAIITLKSINRRNFGMTHILISYILLYITLFFLRGIPSARSEVNERTLLTILVLGSVLFSMYLIKRKINYFSFFFYLIIIVGLLKVPIFLNKMYIIGEGRLSETKFAPQSGLIQKFMLINGSCNISNNMIFSNQDRVLGMYNNYNKITPLPTSKIFKGNSYGDNLKKFQTDSIQFMEVINKNRAWMVVFYYIDEKRERFDSKTNHLVSELFKDSRNNVFKNEDGIIIWPK